MIKIKIGANQEVFQKAFKGLGKESWVCGWIESKIIDNISIHFPCLNHTAETLSDLNYIVAERNQSFKKGLFSS